MPLAKLKQIENIGVSPVPAIVPNNADVGTAINNLITEAGNTFYRADGTLSGNRTVTMGGNSLTLDGSANTVFGDDGSITAGGNLGVAGNATITGDLTVNGTTTTVNSTTVEVADKNIELGSVATPTDVTADGGGITLKGATDKTFNWVDATDAWTSSEHIETAPGRDLILGGATSGKATIAAADATTDYTLVLPADDGLVDQVLTTDGNGVTTWSTPAATAVTQEDDVAPVTAAATNFTVTLAAAPAGGKSGITSVSINAQELSNAEIISVVGTVLTLNVPYAVDATDVVTTKYIA